MFDHLYATLPIRCSGSATKRGALRQSRVASGNGTVMAELTLVEAVNLALAREMER